MPRSATEKLKCQVFGGGGISDNFRGGGGRGGVFCNRKVKVPRFLTNFGGGGYSATEKLKCQDF